MINGDAILALQRIKTVMLAALAATLPALVAAQSQGWALSAPAAAPQPVLPAAEAPRQFDIAAQDRLRDALAGDGITLQAVTLGVESARIAVGVPVNMPVAQAVGRSARAATRVLPRDIGQIIVVPAINGLALAAVTLRRADLESLEFALDGAWRSFARSRLAEAEAQPAPKARPRFSFGVAPYLRSSLYDLDQPLAAHIGLELSGRAELVPGVILSGAVRQKLAGSLGEETLPQVSGLDRVRSDTYLYDQAAETTLQELTAAWYFQPSAAVYGRVSLGYIEQQYAGVSAELLWRPLSGPLSFGVDVNRVQARSFDQDFDLRDYQVTSGHVSAYFTRGNGLTWQLDMGRYLAGDWGATVSLDKELRNGWRIGAFATMTDASEADFGEGAYDKGIRVTIPLGAVVGTPLRRSQTATIRENLGDGGARLDVPDRLYQVLRPGSRPAVQDGWSQFWK